MELKNYATIEGNENKIDNRWKIKRKINQKDGIAGILKAWSICRSRTGWVSWWKTPRRAGDSINRILEKEEVEFSLKISDKEYVLIVMATIEGWFPSEKFDALTRLHDIWEVYSNTTVIGESWSVSEVKKRKSINELLVN